MSTDCLEARRTFSTFCRHFLPYMYRQIFPQLHCIPTWLQTNHHPGRGRKVNLHVEATSCPFPVSGGVRNVPEQVSGAERSERTVTEQRLHYGYTSPWRKHCIHTLPNSRSVAKLVIRYQTRDPITRHHIAAYRSPWPVRSVGRVVACSVGRRLEATRGSTSPYPGEAAAIYIT